MQKTTIIVALVCCVAIAAVALAQEDSAKRQAAAEAASVRAIELPKYQPDLPPGPGREAFAVNCLSCHSTRYVTTQPPLTAAKWEESVRKMIKTYGAPIAEDQVQPIVQYLVEYTKSQRGAASSLAVIASPPANSPSDIALPPDQGPRTASSMRGKEPYAKNCASCHGASGARDGPSAAALLPKPNDLTAARYAPAALEAAITHGVPGTAMPAFPQISRGDLAALVSYASQLGPATGNAPASNDNGRRLYEQNCANCHGVTGAADGIAAAPLARPPANFQLVQPTADSALRVITDGVPGTAMPPWKIKLNDEERKALAEYVRSLFGKM